MDHTSAFCHTWRELHSGCLCNECVYVHQKLKAHFWEWKHAEGCVYSYLPFHIQEAIYNDTVGSTAKIRNQYHTERMTAKAELLVRGHRDWDLASQGEKQTALQLIRKELKQKDRDAEIEIFLDRARVATEKSDLARPRAARWRSLSIGARNTGCAFLGWGAGAWDLDFVWMALLPLALAVLFWLLKRFKEQEIATFTNVASDALHDAERVKKGEPALELSYRSW